MSGASWHLLIHSIPPKPLYLRAKIRHRLARAGAIALKKSVYVLPARVRPLEDFERIVADVVSGGGEAWIARSSFVAGVSDSDLVSRFRSDRRRDFEAFTRDAVDALAASKRAPDSELAARLERLRRRLSELDAIDFFPPAGARTAAAALRKLERALHVPSARPQERGGDADLIGRTWVTRKGVQIDRIASAWLVRRFVDEGARFRFVDPKHPDVAPGEIRFDMMPAEFTHEGDRCTFETLVARTGIAEPAVREIAEIVHDVDLEDGKYRRPDAPGVQRLLVGILLAHPEDEERLARGFALFDDLHRSLARGEDLTKGARR